MSYDRYSLTESDDGMTWAATDIFTGMPAVLNGMTMDKMEVEEAATVVDQINSADRQKRLLYGVENNRNSIPGSAARR